MDQKTKELWVIPATISLVVGVVLGVLFMVWGAWYTGVKLHSPFSLVWFETIITARLPMWVTLVACAFGTIMVGLYRGQAARVNHLEGAEFVGNLDNFKIDPGETTTRGMMLNFRGVHPGADKPLTVQLTFQDLKGTLYQTGPATFRALPGSNGNPFAPSKVPPAT